MSPVPSGNRWMWVSLVLVLIVGVSVGIVVDRLLFSEPAFADAPQRSARPLWFYCGSGAVDVESEPHYLYPEGVRQRLLEGLSSELDLRAEQRQELERLLETSRSGARSFWEDTRHAYCDIRDAFRHSIRALLDEEQAGHFDAMMREADRLGEAAAQSHPARGAAQSP